MNVEVVWGDAEGATPLSAFDGALADAGIHNYNLVTLSSVVPAGAEVTEVGTHEESYPVGSPVATVLAANEASVRGNVSAGLAWQTAAEGGIFYEAVADSADVCREQLEAGIADARELRDWDWESRPSFRIHDHHVEGDGASIVAAVFGPVDTDWGWKHE